MAVWLEAQVFPEAVSSRVRTDCPLTAVLL
jgi:hypothetical protein